MDIIKNTKRVVAVGFLSAIVIACGGNSSEAEKAVENVPVEINMENLTVVDYGIEGMVCAMGCAATIQEEVQGMPGVAVAEVDYEAEKAHVEFDAEIISEEEVIAEIESIADGQYKVIEWVEPTEETIEKTETEVEEGNSADESSEIEVSLSSFEIPNLFTLILDQI